MAVGLQHDFEEDAYGVFRAAHSESYGTHPRGLQHDTELGGVEDAVSLVENHPAFVAPSLDAAWAAEYAAHKVGSSSSHRIEVEF